MKIVLLFENGNDVDILSDGDAGFILCEFQRKLKELREYPSLTDTLGISSILITEKAEEGDMVVDSWDFK